MVEAWKGGRKGKFLINLYFLDNSSLWMRINFIFLFVGREGWAYKMVETWKGGREGKFLYFICILVVLPFGRVLTSCFYL